jgi:hypothetical protein
LTTRAAGAEQLLRPFDELRRRGLQALALSSPLGRTLVRRRSVRVPALLSLHAAAAFALALLAPSFLIALAPLALGVPHLAADVRYLLLRRASPRWWLAASAAFALTLVILRALAELQAKLAPSLAFEQGVASAWVLVGALGGVFVARGAARGIATEDTSVGRARLARGRIARGGIALAAAAAVAAFAIGAPASFRIALLHGHNLIAVAVWALLFRRGGRLGWLPVAMVLVGAGLLASGALLRVTLQHGALSVAGLHLFAAADWLGPGLSDSAAIAVATSFAFLQSVHYAIWLVAVPSGDRPGEGGRAWRVAGRELVRDFTGPGVVIVVVLALLVAAAGIAHAGPTRRLFLSLATFHGWLELAAIAYLFARGEPRLIRPAS